MCVSSEREPDVLPGEARSCCAQPGGASRAVPWAELKPCWARAAVSPHMGSSLQLSPAPCRGVKRSTAQCHPFPQKAGFAQPR